MLNKTVVLLKRVSVKVDEDHLITISVLTAMGRNEQVESHIKLGIENGLTESEIESAMIHIAFYAGWPSAVNGLQKLKSIKDQKVQNGK